MRNFVFIVCIMGIFNGTLFANKIAIVVSEYHAAITEKLLEGATQCLNKNGYNTEDISIAYVPGAYEIPLVVKLLAKTRKFDAIITLGTIPPARLLVDHVSSGISHINLELEIPITWGILLLDSQEQALKEVEPIENNRGWQAAQAAISMVRLVKHVKQCAQAD